MPWMTMPSKNTEPKQTLGARVGEHAAEAGSHRGNVDGFWLGGRQSAKGEERDHRDDEAECADREKHAAPAQKIADHARHRGADQIAGQRHGQKLADGDLAFVHVRHQIADHGHADRVDAAGQDAGDHPHGNEQREVLGEGADQRRHHHHRQTEVHQPGLAEEVADGAERRLREGIGKRKRGRQQRRGADVDAEVVGDFRDDRIDRARE